MIALEGVQRSFSFGSNDDAPSVAALRDVHLHIEAGEYVSIAGPSGSGKSTLLNVIGLLDRPTAGRYLFLEDDVAQLRDGQRAKLRSRHIGFVFQAFHLIPHRSVEENVMLSEVYAPDRSTRSRSARQARAEMALERVGLGHRRGFVPTKLSGGERQRVAIARALVREPALLLCDEPTGNLDRANTLALLELFDELHAVGQTIVVITHDREVAARADRRLGMLDGEVFEETEFDAVA